MGCGGSRQGGVGESGVFFPIPSGHYRTNIISSVGNPNSNFVVSLVLCTVACNDWGTGIVLHIPRDNANPAENE